MVKNLPANAGDTGSISGSGSFLEKEMVHHSSIPDWSGLPFLSPGIFPAQGSNLGLPHCRQMLLPSEPPGKPILKLSSQQLFEVDFYLTYRKIRLNEVKYGQRGRWYALNSNKVEFGLSRWLSG